MFLAKLRTLLSRWRVPVRDESELRYGLRRIIIAWGFGSIFFNTTAGAPFASFARNLGAGDLFFSFLSSVPMLGAAGQFLSSYLVERTGRRRAIFVRAGMVQRLVWIPIALLPWVLPRGGPVLVGLAFLMFTGSFFGNLGSPAWMSWMSDLVPLRLRGKYFAVRMRIGTIIALASAGVAGLVLDWWPAPITYTTLFIAASICGAIDVGLFIKVPEPPVRDRSVPPRLADLVRTPFRNERFRRYISYSICSALGFNITGAVLWLCALETLRMSKFSANLTLLMAHMTGIVLFSTMWGRLVDRYGNRPVLRVTAFGLAFFPLAWVLAEPGRWWFLVLNGFIAGMFWGGLDLANFNLLLGLFPSENRSIYLATYSVVVGLVASVSPMVGGAIAEALRGLHVPVGPVQIINYKVVFLVAIVVRLFAALVMLPRVQEEGARRAREMVRDLTEQWSVRLRNKQ